MLRPRAPTWQYRRGDASPPGEDASLPKEDAFLPLPYKVYKEFYLLSFQVAPSFVSFTSNP